MTEALDIWWSCGRKRRYVKKKAAQRDADKFDQKVYHCRICNGWHCTKRVDNNAPNGKLPSSVHDNPHTGYVERSTK